MAKTCAPVRTYVFKVEIKAEMEFVPQEVKRDFYESKNVKRFRLKQSSTEPNEPKVIVKDKSCYEISSRHVLCCSNSKCKGLQSGKYIYLF